jgi:hypothetical protein
MTSEQCVSCVHLLVGYQACRAFPNGIPDDVFRGAIDHNKPIEGDGGIIRVEKPEITKIRERG